MKALHFGAGNIGRGFIGKVLFESGFDVIFSDIDQNLIDFLNKFQSYSVRIVGKNQDNTINIKNVSAINSNNPKIVKIISSVDLITTAVGPAALDKIALVIADGIMLKVKQESTQILNIIACENTIQASSLLKQAILRKLSSEYYDYLNKYVGFVDCSIDTIIPSIHDSKNYSSLMAEEFKEWIVNVKQFKGKIPNIFEMKLSNNLNSFIERKLFTLNTGHAIAAYLGSIKKYKTIKDAILDEKIRQIVQYAMIESGEVLIKRYNFDKIDHLSYINKILLRFENPFILDSLERIGRNPLQKLGKNERLIKPLLGCIKYGLSYYNLSKGVAAALHYRNQNDSESMQMFSLIKKEGIRNTLIKICGLPIDSKEVCSIILEYYSIPKTIM